MEIHTAPEILSIQVGLLGENCYLVYPKEAGSLYIIDPGDEPAKILQLVSSFNTDKYRILLTHAHVDHISGAGTIAAKLNLNHVTLHPFDQMMYESPENNLDPIMPAAQNLPDPEWLDTCPAEDFTVIETPGHTEGSVCYFFKDLKALFSGDTLFAGSVGRTDLPGAGLYEDLILGIQNRLYILPEDTRVFPGHGRETTISFEKQYNPYTLPR